MFDWNEANVSHIAKHGVTAVEAEQVVLNEPFDLRFEVRGGEERVTQVGESDAGRILVVITTMRGDKIRVVTAIPANRKLRKLYLTQKDISHERGTEEEDLQE